MNQTIHDLMNRRSIRKYKKEQISDEELKTIIDAGLYAPSAKAQQPWKIVAVQSAEGRAEVTRLNAKVRNMGEKADPYYGAPTIILVFAEKDAVEPYFDASLALGNIMNAAAAIGIGSCWINGEVPMFNDEEGKALMKKWGVEENYIGVGACALGYADCASPEAPARRADRVIYVK